MKSFLLSSVLFVSCSGYAAADYTKGLAMFQLYGGGAALGGEYTRAGVDKDDRQYADAGGVLGGQFLYFISDSPCWAIGFDISYANFDGHATVRFLPNRYTESSAKNTTGMIIARLSYPKGHFRPYIQGGIGAHHTSLRLEASPINNTSWSDTSTTESRRLYDAGHPGLAVGGAVGLHIYFNERFFIGAEYKVTALPGPDFGPTAAGRTDGLGSTDGNTAQAGIGLMVGFGF